MEAFALYLIKSVTWLSGFAIIFILFLKNERFFYLNRIYLIAGILTSFFFPLISIHYTVIVPDAELHVNGTAIYQIQTTGNGIMNYVKIILPVLYIAGVFAVITVSLLQGRSVLRAIKKSEVISTQPVKLVKTTDYASAFSFFSYVFVNPSITDIESKEIMIHEMVHIKQKHWFDLLLVELLCMLQWFNPLVWMYVRFIRQNHEYLADEAALQQTADPAVYRAVLLNQIVGAPVVGLTNSFNYSPNKKRFNMMKNITTSPYRKLKVLLILPVFAIVLYSFAKPDYKYKMSEMYTSILQDTTKNVNNNSDAPPPPPPPPPALPANDSANIMTPQPAPAPPALPVKPGDEATAAPVYKVNGVSATKEEVDKIDPETIESVNVVKNVSTESLVDIKLKNATAVEPAVSEEPAIPAVKETDVSFSPLVVVDGVIVDVNLNSIDPMTIESISVLSDVSATKKYGDKAKNRVVEIKLKK